MNLTKGLSTMTLLGLLAMVVGLGAIAPVSAHYVTACVVSPSGTIGVFAGGSTVIKVTVTYAAFSKGDWPMTVTVNPISSGWSANSSTFSDSTAGTHTFYIKITNTVTSTLTGSGTVSIVWAHGSATCGRISMKNEGFPPPVPEFPLGLALLTAAALPALLVVKSKRSVVKLA